MQALAEPSARLSRLDRLKRVLCCPRCRGDLDYSEEAAHCTDCDREYPIRNGKVYFIEVPNYSDSLDGLKGKLKRLLGRYYYSIGINLLAPTYPFNFRKEVNRFLDSGKQVVVDLGCGNHRLSPDIIGVDLFDYDAVDVVCDLTALPFKSDSVDAFVSRSVLEHVRDLDLAVASVRRSTRPGGLSLHLIPFLFPFHASPHDFQRYTHKGQELLFSGFDLVEQRNATGPVTLLLLVVIEWLSILLSCRSTRLKGCVYLLLCGLFFPVKCLDVFFVNRPSYLVMAPTIFSVFRKPAGPAEECSRDAA
jgi:SAM-dependent methyltransferase